MPLRVFLGIAILLLAPQVLSAQLPIPLIVEGRVGYVVPTFGTSGDEAAIKAEAGPSFALGGRIEISPRADIYAAYHHTRFGCGGCAERNLDESLVLEGVEGGVHAGLGAALPLQPWVRGGVLYQTLAVSDGSDRMTSAAGFGFTAAAGLTIPIAQGLELVPGARYLYAPATFGFTFAPDRSLDVAGFAVDVGLAFRL